MHASDHSRYVAIAIRGGMTKFDLGLIIHLQRENEKLTRQLKKGTVTAGAKRESVTVVKEEER